MKRAIADRGGRRQGTASYRSDNDAEREPGSGVTTVHGPRGERDRGTVVVFRSSSAPKRSEQRETETNRATFRLSDTAGTHGS